METYKTQVNNNTQRVYTFTYDTAGNITKVVDNYGYEHRYVPELFVQPRGQQHFRCDHCGNLSDYGWRARSDHRGFGRIRRDQSELDGALGWLDLLRLFGGRLPL